MNSVTLHNIKIILVETTHPGNIGASARAMKTMGLGALRLVNPKLFPSADATVRAAGADDILSEAEIYDSLADAVGDCKYLYGTSTRKRSLQCEVLSPESATNEIINVMDNDINIGIVFGRERTGLTNSELDLCNKMVAIPHKSRIFISQYGLCSSESHMFMNSIKRVLSLQARIMCLLNTKILL